MDKLLIVKSEFEDWGKNKLIEYASKSIESASRQGIMHRLIFGVYVGGGYKVTLGSETMYEGDSFTAAEEAFHSAQEIIPASQNKLVKGLKRDFYDRSELHYKNLYEIQAREAHNLFREHWGWIPSVYDDRNYRRLAATIAYKELSKQ